MQRISSFVLTFLLFLFYFAPIIPAAENTGEWSSKEIARFKAAEANQGVAVDNEFFYAITNRQIGKYKKSDGTFVDGWKDVRGGPFIHLNAGFVKDGKLICAHSNFPGVPMVSSVETWDAKTMKHIESHSFGIAFGSLTWTTEKDGVTYACFADYAGKSGNPDRGPAFTQLIRFDEQWRSTGGWAFPAALVEKFKGSSASCGAFGPGGYLYVTGHDDLEMFVMDFPEAGSILRWIATIPVPFEGQAFSWDPVNKRVAYGIARKTKEVIAIEVTIPEKSK
ncbi:MAG: hypothetical protein FWE67_14965 [Planctomycetaceae bacterium]|nr:hypothetical protein [Planctomycetaceae bacterium]